MDGLIAAFITIFIKDGQITALTVSAINSGLILWLYKYSVAPNKDRLKDIRNFLETHHDEHKKLIENIERTSEENKKTNEKISDNLNWLAGSLQALGLGKKGV